MLKFRFTVARGCKINVVGGAYFTKMAITPDVNEVSSPNLVHMCMSLLWGHSKKIATIGLMVAL